ncbi:MAG: glutamate--tRNA ligase [Capnocytophaga sp.]|nr:glutamate--tRNA ligase [Capnocytophaga sp.]
MSEKVRVRFAPSPTGPLHIGGLRTALFNYLFAKKHGGDFLLRIEDTDQNRYVEGAENYIIEALNWCGIEYDEGVGKGGDCAPYRQSERKEIYAQYAQELINKNCAYYAFDTPQELDNQRKISEEKGETFIYNWHNRESLNNSLSLSKEEVEKRIANGDDYVIRFKMPQEILTMHDLIRGEVVVDTKTLDDKVLFKSDGMPTYHLANIVDDHLMKITQVIRGEEWLPSMPLHILMYRAFGWKAPQFAHLPLILKPAGMGNGKLSKRDGDKMGFPVFPLLWKDPETGSISKGYREDGYLPEALLNFLALLGWNPGTDQELFTKEELIKLFDLERVSKSGARFDIEKAKWFNHQYLQQKNSKELAKDFLKILLEKNIIIPEEKIIRIIDLIRDRATFINDFWELSSFFFIAPIQYDEKAMKKQWKENSSEIITKITDVLTKIEDFSSANTEQIVKEFISENKLGLGQVMPLIRLALVGEMKGPHIFDIAEIIGKTETLDRLEKLKNSKNQ